MSITEQEAIRHLQVAYLGDTEDLVVAKHVAIKALEKQIPKKLLNYNKISAAGNCPICITFVDSYYAYCPNCGQRLEDTP